MLFELNREMRMSHFTSKIRFISQRPLCMVTYCATVCKPRQALYSSNNGAIVHFSFLMPLKGRTKHWLDLIIPVPWQRRFAWVLRRVSFLVSGWSGILRKWKWPIWLKRILCWRVIIGSFNRARKAPFPGPKALHSGSTICVKHKYYKKYCE